MDLKTPPHSVEAEQAVIGGLMFDPTKLEDVTALISADDFYCRSLREIFQAICETDSPDIVTVGQSLSDEDREELGEIMLATPSAANIMRYAEIVRDRSIARKLITVGVEISTQGYEGGDPAELIEKAQSAVMGVSLDDKDEVENLTQSLSKMLDGVQQRSEAGGGLLGVSTGFESLDELTCGLVKSDLIILAARPSMGKTALSLNIAESAAVKNKVPTLFFSMEMPKDQILQRMTASVGRVRFNAIRTGQMEEYDWSGLSNAVRTLNGSPFWVDDRAALSVPQMLRTARKLHKKVNLGLIVVDYLQLATAKTDRNRNEEVGIISRGLKAMAKELDVPVLALSQLNRGVENRADKRPHMSDLRDSGSIEQDADIIAFIYRDEVYNQDTADKGIAEVLIRKNRNGQIGDVRLRTRFDQCRFESIQQERVEQWA